MKAKVFLIALLVGSFFGLAPAAPVFAFCPSVPAGGAYTVSTNCSFAGAVDGVDNGNLTIGTNMTLTLSTNQTIAFNPGFSIILEPGASIVKGTGASISKSYIYMNDGDADGYPSSTSQSLSSGRRRHLMAFGNITDSAGNLRTSVQSDPNDANVNCWQNFSCYVDNDGDGWTTGGLVTVCKKSACNDPIGHLAAASGTADCYDSNAAAKPGQTTYYTTNRGDGSFDYDCNGTSDKEYTATSNCQ